MSKIRRTLTGGKNVNVAGPAGGGGIILQPQTPAIDCPDCPDCPPGGDCVADNFVPQWVALDSNKLPYFAGQTISANEGFGIGIFPPVYGGLFDLSKTPADRAEICCGDVSWGVVVTYEVYGEFHYQIIGGLIIISSAFAEAGTMQMVATPTVCGTVLPALVYDWTGPA